MKINTKLISGFIMVIVLMIALSFYATAVSQKSLRQSVGESSISTAEEILKRINYSIYQKIEALQSHSTELLVKETLSRSNRKFEKLNDIQGYISKEDKKWASVTRNQVTSFMQALMGNKLSDRIRQHIIQFYKQKYGYNVFEEVLVTNRYGANVAQTSKSTNYRQNDKKWWQKTKETGIFISNVGYDESLGTYGIIIGLRIDDEEGNFLGVLKAILSVKEVILEAELRLKRHETTNIMLITREGFLLYSSRAFKFLEKLPNKSLLEMIKNERGFFTAEDGGINRLFYYAHSRGYREL